MNLTIADLINELSNLGQIHGMDAPARVWNTSKSEPCSKEVAV